MSLKFTDLLSWHDEFVFYLKGVKFEIVNVNGVSVFLSDDKCGTLICSYKDKDDLLANGFLLGHKISEMLDEIVVL